ncbi:MAG: VOC family protein [Tetrasphaera sp.]
MSARIDHLVVAARDLDSGRAWLEDMLGVRLQPGGEHAMFGTHNLLLSLGGEEYVELLAVNRAVPKPCAVYPLGLESPDVERQLRRSPYLLHWILRVTGLDGPEATELSRGDNRWRTVLTAPGELPMGGVARV